MLVGTTLLVMAALVASCGAEEAGNAATTRPQPATSTTTTTVPGTTVTIEAPSAPDLPPLLVSGNHEIRLVDVTNVTPLVSGVAVSMAVPDLSGGIVYGTEQQGSASWVWDPDAGMSKLQGDPGWVPSAVYRLAPGGDPQLLVDGAEGRVSLVQVIEFEGHPSVIYRAWQGGPGDCTVGTDECVWMTTTEHLWRRDLATGETVDMGIVGSFESSVIGIRFSETALLVTTEAYGAGDGCGALFAPDALGEVDPDIWIGEGGVLWRTCEFGPTVGCEPDESFGESWCWGSFSAAIDDTGTSVAYAMAHRAWSGAEYAEAPVLVLLDAPGLTELARIVIGEPGTVTTWIEHDGEWTVIGRKNRDGGDLPPVVVGPDGTVYELPAATYVALWHEGR